MAKNGGRIEIDSKVGEGTAVTMVFPGHIASAE